MVLPNYGLTEARRSALFGLQQKLWPSETFVDFEHGLNKAINKLREALSDDANNPRYIETLPRRGYRFVGPVESGQWFVFLDVNKKEHKFSLQHMEKLP